MKCLVLHGFAGLQYAGAKGKEINLPTDEAISLQHAGIVKILEDFNTEMAYETPEEAVTQKRIIKPKKRGL